ncbi:hypothetical protein A2U01_0100264, partial [Trifolium medium]|nr:hypothetical protein [Trifolium medium]
VLGGEREDEGSPMVPVVNSDDGRDDVLVDGVANSGENDDSGYDMDVDMSKDTQHEGRLEVVGDRTMCGQVAKGGE